MQSIARAVRRALVGKPFHDERFTDAVLPKRTALPVFSADALSSVAYAPDEIILTLALAGTAAAAVSRASRSRFSISICTEPTALA